MNKFDFKLKEIVPKKGYEFFTNINCDQVVYDLPITECSLKILGHDMQDLTCSRLHIMLVFLCALVL